MKKTVLITFISIILSFTVSCAEPEPKRHEAQFLELFDTVTQVVSYSGDSESFENHVNMIYEELDEYHKLYDIYNDYDGINNIKSVNDMAGIKPVEVDKKIIDLLVFAKDIHKLTDGRVNAAYGSVLAIWHDYREEGTDDPENAKLPPLELLEDAALHTDIGKVVIDEEAMTVYLDDPRLQLDVGAFAKGFAVERICEKLMLEGFSSGLISVGGNVRVIGEKPSDDGLWKLGIQNPDTDSSETNLHIVKLKDTSLVTSGSYIRYYTVDGREYHHIIDPGTLFPADRFSAVTVICRDSGYADMLSTALYLMAYEDGLRLLEKIPGTYAMWILHDGTELYSPGFRDFMEGYNQP